jgi:hypothetical protein
LLAVIAFFAILAVYVFFVYRSPACAAGGVFCLYGLKQWGQASSPFLAEHRAIANMVFAAVVGFAWVLAMFRKKAATRYSSVAIPLFSLLGLALASYFWCIYPPVFVGIWIYAAPYLLVYVVLAPLLIRDPDDAVHAVWTLLVMGFVLVLLLQYTTTWDGRGIQFEQYYTSGFAADFTAGNPLAVASLASSVFILACLVNVNRGKMWWAILRWPIALQSLVTTVKTGSRGPAIMAVICAAVFMIFSRGLKSVRQIMTLCVVSILLTVIAYFCYTNLIENNARWDYVGMQNELQNYRVHNCELTLDRWAKGFPWTLPFGYGSSGSFAADVVGFYPEVVPIEVLCEEGLVGFALLVATIVVVYRTFFRALRVASDSPVDRGLVAAIGAMATFQFGLSCKGGNLLGSTDFMGWTLILGQFGAALARRHRASDGQEKTELVYSEYSLVTDPYADVY